MQKNPHVKLVYTAIGGGSAGGDPFAPQGAAEVRKATLTINMTPRGERRGLSKQAIEAQLREALAALPGARVKVGFGGSCGEVRAGAGRRGRRACWPSTRAWWSSELRTIPGIGNVTSTASLVRPELIVRPDFARAADLGVTSAAIADTLRIATAGDYDQAPGQAQPVAAPGAGGGEAARRRAQRPGTAVAPGGAGRARAGDAGQRGHA